MQHVVLITLVDGSFRYTIVSPSYLLWLEDNLIYAKVQGWIRDWDYL